MNYTGKSHNVRVRIIATSGQWANYFGQECDATLYEEGIDPQIDTEQLTPPLPRWQSINAKHIDVIEEGRKDA